MSYIPERFGMLALPVYNPDMEVGTGKYETAYTLLESGGAIDQIDEDDIARPGVTTITYTGTLEAATRELLTVALDNLRGYVGTRARLYARVLTETSVLSEGRYIGTGELRWRWARLVSVQMKRRPGSIRHQDVVFTWQSESPWWYGTHYGTWYLDAGNDLDAGLYLDTGITVTLSASPVTYSLVNNGNRPIEDIRFVLAVKTTNCTAFGIATATADLDFTGTVLANKSLVIDTGQQSVLNDNVDAYDHPDFDFGAGHVIDPWIRAAKSATTVITFTNTGAGVTSTVDLAWWEQWA